MTAAVEMALPVTYCPQWCVLVQGVEHPDFHASGESFSGPGWSVHLERAARPEVEAAVTASTMVVLSGWEDDKEVRIEMSPSSARSLIRHLQHHADVADGLIEDK